MKTLISAVFLVSLLVASVQAYDYVTEAAKGNACVDKYTTVLDACKSDSSCKTAIDTFETCSNNNSDVTQSG